MLTSPETEKWRALVAELQSSARRYRDSTSVVTIRLLVKDGMLDAWSQPSVARWRDESCWQGELLKGLDIS